MLRVHELSKTYPNGIRGLDAVTLDVPPGLFGLLGPNGAGKSSLMRTLATLQGADSGSVMLDDVDLLNQPEQARRQIGYLPQDFGLYPQLTAVELLEHLAVLKDIGPVSSRRQRVEEMLALTNLTEAAHRPLGTYSGGMRQRFGIAQALIANPRLLIVDEPTAGLDPAERNRFHNLLVSASADMVVLLSTHIVADVEDLCPNMAIMAGGGIRATGTPGALRQQLEGRVWRQRVSQAEAESARQRLNVISVRLVGGQSEIHVLTAESPGPDFEPVEPDLEDVYFAELSR